MGNEKGQLTGGDLSSEVTISGGSTMFINGQKWKNGTKNIPIVVLA